MRVHLNNVFETCARSYDKTMSNGHDQLVAYKKLGVVYQQVKRECYGTFETVFDWDDALVS